MEKDNWISVEDKKPIELDEQIVVTNGNGFYEIVWFNEDEAEYQKPFRYDEHDYAAFRKGGFTHWMPLRKPSPPQTITK